MVRKRAEGAVDKVTFQRPDISQKLYELIPVFPGWENTRTMPVGYHRHLFYELLWITSGSIVQVADFTEFTTTTNRLLFLPKGIVHHCTEGQSANGILLLFNEDFFSLEQAVALRGFLIFDPLAKPIQLTLNPGDEKVLHSIVDLLRNDSVEPVSFSHNLVFQSLLYTLLYKVEQIAQRSADSLPVYNGQNQELYFRFSQLLDTHFRAEHTVRFYASALHVSPKQLARSLAISNHGHTTLELIHARLIMEAKRLLAYSAHSVKEIGFDIGMDDAAYFSRLFKQKTGVSPEAFRTLWSLKSC